MNLMRSIVAGWLLVSIVLKTSYADIPELEAEEKAVLKDLKRYHHVHRKKKHLEEGKRPTLELFKDVARLYFDQHDNPAIQKTHQSLAVKLFEVMCGKYGIREERGPQYMSQVEWCLDFIVYHNISSGFNSPESGVYSGLEALCQAVKNLGGFDYLIQRKQLHQVGWIFFWHMKAHFDRQTKFSTNPPKVDFKTYLLSDETYRNPEFSVIDDPLILEMLVSYCRLKLYDNGLADFISPYEETYLKVRGNIDRLYHFFVTRQSKNLKDVPSSLNGSKVQDIIFPKDDPDKVKNYSEAAASALLKVSEVKWTAVSNYDVPGNNNSCGINANYGFLKGVKESGRWGKEQEQSRVTCYQLIKNFDNPLHRYLAVRDISNLILLDHDTLQWKAKSAAVASVLNILKASGQFGSFQSDLINFSLARTARYTVKDIEEVDKNIRVLMTLIKDVTVDEKKNHHDEIDTHFKNVITKAKEALQALARKQAKYNHVPFQNLYGKLFRYINFIVNKKPELVDDARFIQIQEVAQKLEQDEQSYGDLMADIKRRYFFHLYKNNKDAPTFDEFLKGDSLIEKSMSHYIATSSAQIDESGGFNRLMAISTNWDVLMLQHDAPLIAVKSIYHSGPKVSELPGVPIHKRKPLFCPMIVGGSKSGGHFNRLEIGSFVIDGRNDE